MKVILTGDVKNIGRRGELKNVKDGYARNFLLPNGLAVIATEFSIKTLNIKRVVSDKQTEELKEALGNIIKETAELPIAFSIKTGKKGEVFGSLRSDEIKAELVKKYPILDEEHLEVKKDHLKELGVQKIPIKIAGAGQPATPAGGHGGRGIEGQISIDIRPETA